MKLSVLALDYDGTIAEHGVLDPEVRQVIAEARAAGIVVLLVTGRILEDLRAVAGPLEIVDAVVAENGAVVSFPEGGRAVTLGSRPPVAFLDELARRGVQVRAGDCVVEADAAAAEAIVRVVREQQLPLALLFNRGRLMVLPQATSKASGLREALRILRLSEHNAVAIGDAENDHAMLDLAEIGAAVSWGSPALRAAADDVVAGDAPRAVAGYVRRMLERPRLPPERVGRRRLSLGATDAGRPVALAVRGRNVLITGDPRSGKSWVAGLLCEQLILQRYCLCVVDPEGDYRELEALPGVVTLGGTPRPQEVLGALRHPDVSIVVDLSQLDIARKRDYVRALLPLLKELRRATGLPHRVIVDEAHYFAHGPDVPELLDLELAGYTLITYRLSDLHPSIRTTGEMVLATRVTSRPDVEALLEFGGRADAVEAWAGELGSLRVGEAVLLPLAEEAAGELCRFHLLPRLTAHVRHRQKYVDVPVPLSAAFAFTRDGAPTGEAARTLPQLSGLIAAVPDNVLDGHLRRGDFSRWIVGVFGDQELGERLEAIEALWRAGYVPGVRDELARAIRDRYSLTEVAV